MNPQTDGVDGPTHESGGPNRGPLGGWPDRSTSGARHRVTVGMIA